MVSRVVTDLEREGLVLRNRSEHAELIDDLVRMAHMWSWHDDSILRRSSR